LRPVNAIEYQQADIFYAKSTELARLIVFLLA
jgi:hypothetical protein